jgi:hypothetical protein
MSGLGDALDYIGGSIDKPGRAVRGLLAGKPREGLAALPFSDTLGITDENERTSGRDLTDKWGLTQKHDKGWGAWGAGVGTELALDPLNLIPAGMLGHALKDTRFGKAAGSLGRHFAGDEAGSLRLDYLAALKDESTPVGRMKRLADEAGVHVFPDRSPKVVSGWNPQDTMAGDDAFRHFMRYQFNDGSGVGHALAHYDPNQRIIVPNVANHSALWFDQKAMADQASRMHQPPKPVFAGGYPESTATHEIGHALHHRNVLDPSVPSNFPGLHDKLGLPNPDDVDWARSLGVHHSVNDLSAYARTNPKEFVAESFTKMAGDLASGRTAGVHESLPPKLWDLYHRKLSGPQVTPPFLAKLSDYLRR